MEKSNAERYGRIDADGFRLIRVVESGPLENAAALVVKLAEVRKLYANYRKPAPPLPDEVVTYAPCALLITERHNRATGEQEGRVRFFRPDGTTLSDERWTICERG